MNNHCPNCGAKLQENARFCDNCGSPVMKVAQEVRQQNFVPNTPTQQQQNAHAQQQNAYEYNPAYYPGYGKSAAKPKLNYILFMFITSIIFFSYLAVRLLVRLVLPGTWDRTGFVFYDATNIIYTVLALVVFAIMLAQLIVAINCFNKRNNSLENIKSPAANLSGLCLASFLLSLALLIVAVLLFVSTSLPISNYYLDYVFFTADMEAFVIINLVFAIIFFIYDIVFLVFASINMAKAMGLKRQVNELYEKEQAEEIE